MMGKSAFFSEGTAGQMKSAPSFAKDDDSTLPKEPNGSKIRLGPKPIWGMSVDIAFQPCRYIRTGGWVSAKKTSGAINVILRLTTYFLIVGLIDDRKRRFQMKPNQR